MSAVAIVGNNLAALVAALTLGGQGHQVMLLNPAPVWGGHFGGLELASWRFDPGMVLYEFDSLNREDSADILTYDPDVRNDCGRFFARVQGYIGQHVVTVAVPEPKMLFRRRIYPDLIIANRIESLRMMDPDSQALIRNELAAIANKGDRALHPARKIYGAEFKEADFATVSLANHGRFLHEAIMEPLCRKILGTATRDILGLYHRAAWLPLYYPETLLSQFGPAPQELAATPFHYPVAGYAGALAASLAAKVLSEPNVRVLRSAVTGIDRTASPVLRLADGNSIAADRTVWTLDAGALIALADPATQHPSSVRASIGLCFIAIPAKNVKEHFSTLLVIDPEFASYRVTNQDICAASGAGTHRLVAEFSTDQLDSRGITGAPAQQQAILHELADLGLIDSPGSVAYCSVKSMKGALMIPSAANRNAFDEQKSWLKSHLPAVHIAGPSAGFFAGSMNDQIIQGLKIGAELGAAAP